MESLMRLDLRALRAAARRQGLTLDELAGKVNARLDLYHDGILDVEVTVGIRLARLLGVGLETIDRDAYVEVTADDAVPAALPEGDDIGTLCAALLRCNHRLSRDSLARVLGWTLRHIERVLYDADRTVAHLGLRVSADESGRLGLEPAPGRLSDGQRMALDDMAQNSMLTKREELQWVLLGVADRWLQRKEPSLFRRLEECGYVQHEEGSGWVPTESVAFSLDPDMT